MIGEPSVQIDRRRDVSRVDSGTGVPAIGSPPNGSCSSSSDPRAATRANATRTASPPTPVRTASTLDDRAHVHAKGKLSADRASRRSSLP